MNGRHFTRQFFIFKTAKNLHKNFDFLTITKPGFCAQKKNDFIFASSANHPKTDFPSTKVLLKT